jgi:hypothetical protein
LEGRQYMILRDLDSRPVIIKEEKDKLALMVKPPA